MGIVVGQVVPSGGRGVPMNGVAAQQRLRVVVARNRFNIRRVRVDSSGVVHPARGKAEGHIIGSALKRIGRRGKKGEGDVYA